VRRKGDKTYLVHGFLRLLLDGLLGRLIDLDHFDLPMRELGMFRLYCGRKLRLVRGQGGRGNIEVSALVGNLSINSLFLPLHFLFLSLIGVGVKIDIPAGRVLRVTIHCRLGDSCIRPFRQTPQAKFSRLTPYIRRPDPMLWSRIASS
jgi:hypothetical protein